MITTDSVIPPPARPYQGRPAGLISRFLASAVDMLVVVLALAVLYAGWATLRFLLRPIQFALPDPSLLLIFVAGFMVLTVYLTVGWTMTGRTYGDHLMGLRVVTAAGGRLHLARALVRALLCAVFPIGLLWTALSAHNLSVQDILVRTSVRYDWHTVDPAGYG